GGEFKIAIRGENTITGDTEPLVVIDGVIGGRIKDINPADIQTMDILKDASSTAIYGSRGANGVIIITSKRGASGKPKYTLDSYFGYKTPAHLPELQTAQQFYQMTLDKVMDGGAATAFTSNEMEMINSGKSTDWVKLINKPSFQTSNTLAISGGGQNTTYRVSGGYLQEDGSYATNTYKKYNLNAGVDSRINKYLKMGLTSFLNYSTNPRGSLEANRSAFRARPTGTVYYDDLVNPSDGNDAAIGPWNDLSVWMGIKDAQVPNPLLDTYPENVQFQINTTNIMGNAYIEVAPFRGLTFRSSLSASVIGEKQGDYRGTYSKDRAAINLPRAFYETRDNTSYTIDNILTYDYSNKDHRITVTALQSAFMNTAERYAIAVDKLPYASIWYNLGTAAVINSVSSSYAKNTLQSYMGRINYSFSDKYLLTLTGRTDGASQLSEGNKWAFFPSAAVAWRIINEDFMKNSNLFSDLKLRVSYGQVGNSTVSPYSTQATVLNTPYDFDGNSAFGFAPGNLGNKDLKWERSKELNIGLNMGFLDNRIVAAIELYDRKTEDLILNTQIPSSTGFNTVFANVGQVGNKGVEVALNTVNLSNNNLTWTSSFIFSKNNNKILALASGVSADKGNKLFVGSSVKSNFYYKFDGIWQLADSVAAKSYGQAPGSVKVVDQNKDGVISSTDAIDDRVVLGSELPDWTLGVTNKFDYKNFDLSFFIYYRKGTQYRNGMLSGTMGEYTGTRYNHIVLNYWTSKNPTNDYFGVAAAQPYREAIQYQDASFLRISDITVGYSFTKSLLDKIGFERVRVYAQITNPFVFTKYDGMDPEYNSNTYIDEVPNIIYALGFNIGF
ncbi:MAG TPA: SusC/RagA family TonB-linked outer membrane protein, partial [Agriterribacter sp.]|nr:SusC/RagA family TonB-linked outer membrane protein [Agriterribacter sp.]